MVCLGAKLARCVCNLAVLVATGAFTVVADDERSSPSSMASSEAEFVSRMVDCERRLDLGCGGVNSFEEPPGACLEHGEELPPPATTLFPDTTAASLGLLGRSLRFGRVLWCLTRLSDFAVVLELFAGTGGGSTLLLAHSLTQKLEGALHSFERNAGNVAHALHVMRTFGIPSRVLVSEELMGISGGLRAIVNKSGRGLWLWYGDAMASLPRNETGAPCALQALCEALPRVDLVVIDPQYTNFAREWSVVERSCQPHVVGIHNANLPEVSWIRAHLLSQRLWLEVANGSHPSPWEEGGVRKWSVLCRAPALVP